MNHEETSGLRARDGPDKRTLNPSTYATGPEQDSIIAAAHGIARSSKRDLGIPIDAMIEFAIGSGLRAGELVTHRLADVHVDGEHPHVVVRYGTAPDLPTKTGKIREVPLFGRSLDAMKRWLAPPTRFERVTFALGKPGLGQLSDLA